jgi:hypothetical protein
MKLEQKYVINYIYVFPWCLERMDICCKCKGKCSNRLERENCDVDDTFRNIRRTFEASS